MRLYDSAAAHVRPFTPLVPGQVSMYVCGLTVQSSPHIGHIRSAVAFDVLRRWLLASGFKVRFIRNITDIDDKILANAADQGRPWFNLAYEVSRELARTYDRLHVLPPTYEPLATGHIPEMIDLIQTLIQRGHAYVASDASGDVYFDVRSWPAYGELSGQKVDDMQAAPDSDPRGKRDPRDFALWKGAKPSEPSTASWSSPWGRGRPGWHIECSAMASKYLGEAFDIHGGGIDLKFPHHENEQAQSRAAGHDFASWWMHNAWITTAGEKMSKSLGNSLVVTNVLEQVRGAELRYYLASTHYRSHVEFSFEALHEAAAAYTRIERFLERAGGVATDGELPAEFRAAMDDDLGTPAAVAVVHEAVRKGNSQLAAGEAAAATRTAHNVRAMLDVFGLDPADPHWQAQTDSRAIALQASLDELISGLLEAREQAREQKDFAAADQIRDQLAAAGIVITDTGDGATWSLT